jgi:hypothetical protein
MAFAVQILTVGTEPWSSKLETKDSSTLQSLERHGCTG